MTERGLEPQLAHGESCKPCIERFVGPALNRIGHSVGVQRCGGCGLTVEKFFYTYWFPWGGPD